MPLAADEESLIRILNKLAAASNAAHSLGLKVHAGHGLDYSNFARF